MIKLDNKGFAITGILYTLLILFLMIVLSVLSGLSSRKNMLEKSTERLQESFIGNNTNATTNISYVNTNKSAPVNGKYIFELSSDNTTETITCTTYLKKGDSIDKNSLANQFIPKDCNDYNYTFSFEAETLEGMKMTLKDIYSFEEE